MTRSATAASPLQLQLFPTGEPSTATPRPPASRPVAGPPRVSPKASPETSDEPPKEDAPELAEPTEEVFLSRLRDRMPKRVGVVTLTNNRSTIVSARTAGGDRLNIRIHRCFAAAPDETLAAVATFLTSGKHSRARSGALALIRAYFERHRPSPAAGHRRRRTVLRPVGQAIDLREVRDALNREYFDDQLEVHVTWGRLPSRRRRGGGRRKTVSVRLGTYGGHDQVVRIHRCLDRVDVPRYVVESVVYHEMLHAAVPPVETNGRRRIHTPEFRRRERLFSHFQRAERWIDRNLHRLL